MSLRSGQVCAPKGSSAEGSRPGFTLIELLVVVSVILILVSLLLPGLSGARSVARAAQCLSNQRQILVAMHGYAGENKDVVPREGTVDPRPGHERDYLSWAVALRPLLDSSVSTDEDPNDLFLRAPYYKDPGRAPDGHRIHFMVNAMPFLSRGSVDPAPAALGDYLYRRGPTPLARLRFPEQTVYLGEYADDQGGAIAALIEALRPLDIERAQYYDVWGAEHIVPGPDQRIAPKRHGDGGNVAFLDGHCRAARSSELVTLDLWDDRDYGRRRGGN